MLVDTNILNLNSFIRRLHTYAKRLCFLSDICHFHYERPFQSKQSATLKSNYLIAISMYYGVSFLLRFNNKIDQMLEFALHELFTSHPEVEVYHGDIYLPCFIYVAIFLGSNTLSDAPIYCHSNICPNLFSLQDFIHFLHLLLFSDVHSQRCTVVAFVKAEVVRCLDISIILDLSHDSDFKLLHQITGKNYNVGHILYPN